MRPGQRIDDAALLRYVQPAIANYIHHKGFIVMKIRISAPLVMSAVLLLCPACFRQDKRTITVKVPQLVSIDCLSHIQLAAKQVDGIEQVTGNVENKTVDVTYNAMKLGIRNIEFILARAGFDANDTPASPQARAALPEGCR